MTISKYKNIENNLEIKMQWWINYGKTLAINLYLYNNIKRVPRLHCLYLIFEFSNIFGSLLLRSDIFLIFFHYP